MSESNKEAELTLGPFDRHGVTRARYGRQWIEVEHGIPEEVVRAEIVGGRRPRGRILDIVKPSPDRVRPPCPYFRDWYCGGCQWQHIDYQSQLDFKQWISEEAMQEHGLTYRITAVHTLTDPWRYRYTAGISLGRNAGFRRHGSLAIVPIEDCPISHPLIGELMAHLNEGIRAEQVPDFRGRVRIDVRIAGSQEEPYLQAMVRPTEEGKHPPEEDMRRLLDFLDSLTEVGGVAVLEEDEEIRVVKGELMAPTSIEGRPVWLSGGSFFQTNQLLLPQLLTRLREEAEPLAGKRIADVYGGVGVFGLFLAEGAAEVVEIEFDPIAVEAGMKTAEEWGLQNMRFAPVSAEEGLAGDEKFDVVIVDPPRSGLTEQARDTLVETRPLLLLYVSCLAQSLARDLTYLTEAGYTLEHLELFDFYPQTYHVELLAVLRQRNVLLEGR